MKPDIIWAVTCVNVCEGRYTGDSNQFHSLKLLDSEIGCGIRAMMTLTPITNTGSVLPSRVKHQTDNHKARRDGTFTHAEDETNDEETGEVLASSMATKGNCPYKDVQTGSVWPQITVYQTKNATCLIHFPTGNLCRAKFCGNSKAR